MKMENVKLKIEKWDWPWRLPAAGRRAGWNWKIEKRGGRLTFYSN